MQQVPIHPAVMPGVPAVTLRGASFSWAPSVPEVLSDISLQVRAGQLVMVVGEVGSGKSSLLAGLLGELCTLKVSARVSDVGCSVVKPLKVVMWLGLWVGSDTSQ